MANKLVGPFDPIEFSQEVLSHLKNSLKFANRVHRGYDRETRGKGETISIGVPSKFAVTDAGAGTVQDVNTGQVQIKLNQWKEVVFSLTDKEDTLSRQDTIDLHIKPAAYALANYIDQQLATFALQTPWTSPVTGGGVTISDITTARAVLRQNGVPVDDGMTYGVVDAQLEGELLANAAFGSYNVAGTNANDTLLNGSLAKRFGIEWSADQNVPKFTAGTNTAATGVLDAPSGAAAGTGSITVGSLTAGHTIKAGETITLAGNTQKYVVLPTYDSAGNITSSTYTVDGAGKVVLPISPELVQAYPNNTQVSFSRLTAHTSNILFHKHAFALAMAPLNDERLRSLNIKAESVFDSDSNLALRLVQWADPGTRKIKVGLDVLFGFKVLDPNKAVRFIR